MKTPPLWLRNGIPSHLIEIIRSFYRNFTCSVGDGDILCEVKTGVRQRCVMSTVLFNLVVDWIMRRTTEDQNSGIRWTPLSYLEDLDHADDLALLSHTQSRLKPEFFKVSSFQPLRLKHFHCDDLHTILSLSAVQIYEFHILMFKARNS